MALQPYCLREKSKWLHKPFNLGVSNVRADEAECVQNHCLLRISSVGENQSGYITI